MEIDQKKWEIYIKKTALIMDDFLNGIIDIDQSFNQMSDNFDQLIPPEYQEHESFFEEVDQDLLNTISEIDGDIKGYREVLEFLKTNPTPKKFREFMDRPI